MDIAGNQVRPRRPVSIEGLRRPETEFSRKQKSSNPTSYRHKQDNILKLEFELPKPTVQQEYKGSGDDVTNYMTAFLSMPLLADENEVVHQSFCSEPSQPYQSYGENI